MRFIITTIRKWFELSHLVYGDTSCSLVYILIVSMKKKNFFTFTLKTNIAECTEENKKRPETDMTRKRLRDYASASPSIALIHRKYFCRQSVPNLISNIHIINYRLSVQHTSCPLNDTASIINPFQYSLEFFLSLSLEW